MFVGKGKLEGVFDDVACGEQTSDFFCFIKFDCGLERKLAVADDEVK